MTNLILKFWYGQITLWKSFWLVGELLNSLIILLIFNLEINYLNNISLYKDLPYLNFSTLNFFTKTILIIWTLYITIGVWRSAENYKGRFTWIVLTLIFLSYRIFTFRIIFL